MKQLDVLFANKLAISGVILNNVLMLYVCSPSDYKDLGNVVFDGIFDSTDLDHIKQLCKDAMEEHNLHSIKIVA